MVDFYVYKYSLSKTNKRNLFTTDGVPVELRAREEFGKLLTTRSLDIHKPSGNGGSEVFTTENTCHNEVAVFTLENNKTIGQWVKRHKNKLPSNPFCWVIIDNRPGKMRMLVQDNSAWNSTDEVRDLLQRNFNGKLAETGLEIEFRAETRVADVWQAINRRCSNNNTRVKSVTFEFINPQKADGMDIPQRLYGIVRNTVDTMAGTNAYMLQQTIRTVGRDHLFFDRTHRDISQLVRLCCMNGYKLIIRFTKGKAYVASTEERVYEGLEEEGYLTLFSSSATTFSNDASQTFDLIIWLDTLSTENKKRRKDERVA